MGKRHCFQKEKEVNIEGGVVLAKPSVFFFSNYRKYYRND